MLKALVNLVALAQQAFWALFHSFRRVTKKKQPVAPLKFVYLVRVYVPGASDPYRKIPSSNGTVYTESVWTRYIEAKKYADNLHDSLGYAYPNKNVAAWATMCPVAAVRAYELN